nr:TPA_inf: spike protein [Golden Chinese loach bafinivirus]
MSSTIVLALCISLLALASAQLNTSLPDCPIPTCTSDLTPPIPPPSNFSVLTPVMTLNDEYLLLAPAFTGVFTTTNMPMPANPLNRVYTLNYGKMFVNVPDSSPATTSTLEHAVVATATACTSVASASWIVTTAAVSVLANQKICLRLVTVHTTLFLYDSNALCPGGFMSSPSGISVTSILTSTYGPSTSPTPAQLLANAKSLLANPSVVLSQAYRPVTNASVIIDASRCRAATSPSSNCQKNFSPSFFDKASILDNIYPNTIFQTARGITRETTIGYILNAAKHAGLYIGSPAYYGFLLSTYNFYLQALQRSYDFQIGRLCQQSVGCCMTKGFESFDTSTWLFHYTNLINSGIMPPAPTNPVVRQFQMLFNLTTGHSMQCDGTQYGSDNTYNLNLLKQVVGKLSGGVQTTPFAERLANLTDTQGYLRYSDDYEDGKNFQNYMPFVTYLLAVFYPTFTVEQKFQFHQLLQSVCYFDPGYITRNTFYQSVCHVASLTTAHATPYPVELQFPFTSAITSGFNAYPVLTPIGTVAIGNLNPFEYDGVCYGSTCILHPTLTINQILTVKPLKWQVVPEGITVVTAASLSCVTFPSYAAGSLFFTTFTSSAPCQAQTLTRSFEAPVPTVEYTSNVTQYNLQMVQPYGRAVYHNNTYQPLSFVAGAFNVETHTYHIPPTYDITVLTPVLGNYSLQQPDILTPLEAGYYYDPLQPVVNSTDIYRITVDFAPSSALRINDLVYNCTAFICGADFRCVEDFAPFCSSVQPSLAVLKQSHARYLQLHQSLLDTFFSSQPNNKLFTAASHRARRDLGYGSPLTQPSWVYQLGATAAVPLIGPPIAIGLLGSRVANIENTLAQITQGVKDSINLMNDKVDAIAYTLSKQSNQLAASLAQTNEAVNVLSRQTRTQFSMVAATLSAMDAKINTQQQVHIVGNTYQSKVLALTNNLQQLTEYVVTLREGYYSCLSDLSQQILTANCMNPSDLQLAINPNQLGQKLVLTHFVNGSQITYYFVKSSNGAFKPLPRPYTNTQMLVANTAFNPETQTCYFCGENFCDISATTPCDYAETVLTDLILASYPTPSGIDMLRVNTNGTFTISHGAVTIINTTLPPAPVVHSDNVTVIELAMRVQQLEILINITNLNTTVNTVDLQPLIDDYNQQIQAALAQIIDVQNTSTPLWIYIVATFAGLIALVLVISIAVCVSKNQHPRMLALLR